MLERTKVNVVLTVIENGQFVDRIVKRDEMIYVTGGAVRELLRNGARRLFSAGYDWHIAPDENVFGFKAVDRIGNTLVLM